MALPLVRRREALRRVLRPGDEVVAVPAIATEGIALYAAVVAQGIAGVLARHRSSPYLAGVRSRLWRFVAAAPGAARTGVAGAGSQAAETGPISGAEPGPAAAASGPVLALIRRLPLEDR
jgi:bifunctional non-homologous end joining protein LigD